MSPRDFAQTIIAERAAHTRLCHLLRVHGNPKSRLAEIDKQFKVWRELAGIVAAAGPQ